MPCTVEVESKYGYFVDRLCDAYEVTGYEKTVSDAQTLPTESFDYRFPSYNEAIFNLCEALNVLGVLYSVKDVPMSIGSKLSFGKILHTA